MRTSCDPRQGLRHVTHCGHHIRIDLISPKEFHQPASIVSVLLEGTDLNPLNNTSLKGLNVLLF